MELELRPSQGTDKLLFGTERKEVRSLIMKGKVFVTPPTEPENDMYERDGLILGYDEKDNLEFIEVIAPSTCHFEAVSLTNQPLKDVLKAMRRLGHESFLEDESHTFKALGIVLFCPSGKTQSVSIFRDGYYDSL